MNFQLRFSSTHPGSIGHVHMHTQATPIEDEMQTLCGNRSRLIKLGHTNASGIGLWRIFIWKNLMDFRKVPHKCQQMDANLVDLGWVSTARRWMERLLLARALWPRSLPSSLQSTRTHNATDCLVGRKTSFGTIHPASRTSVLRDWALSTYSVLRTKHNRFLFYFALWQSLEGTLGNTRCVPK